LVQNGAGQITLQPWTNGFEVKSPPPTYTLTATINGTLATIKAVDSTSQPAGTANAAITGYTPATQGRMMRVDLWINEDPYLAWTAGYFPDPNSPDAAKSADPDHDGFTNEQELAAGTDPLNGGSSLRVGNLSRAANGSTFTLSWASVPGKTYQVETSQGLQANQWTSVGDPITANGSTSAHTVPTAPVESGRFFRVKVLP
jgi:hypothetical protein